MSTPKAVPHRLSLSTRNPTSPLSAIEASQTHELWPLDATRAVGNEETLSVIDYPETPSPRHTLI
eukprot:m.113363 g.113363  ORF g.113363 m.113363 type:complete len:65 (+) comp13019_c0_seq1:3127-3321(+)